MKCLPNPGFKLLTIGAARKQLRKCNALMRSHGRQLDRDIARNKQQETKAKNLILEADSGRYETFSGKRRRTATCASSRRS
jgi:hypothetical protein